MSSALSPFSDSLTAVMATCVCCSLVSESSCLDSRVPMRPRHGSLCDSGALVKSVSFFVPLSSQIRIRDPNQGGRDVTEEILAGGSGSRNSTPPVGCSSSTPTPPQVQPALRRVTGLSAASMLTPAFRFPPTVPWSLAGFTAGLCDDVLCAFPPTPSLESTCPSLLLCQKGISM